MDNEIKVLQNSLIMQAKVFLDDAGEFYPFAAAIGRNDDIKSIGIYFENDHPDSQEVLEALENAITKGLSNGDYKIAAIGVDVFLPSNGEEDRKSALEIRILREESINKVYVPYYEKGNEYFFEKVF